jgi:DNA repair protein RecN (Recombination protein N)
LEDLITEIRRFRDGISFSPEILEETVSRLNTLDGLKRKYGGTIVKVLEYQEKVTADLEKIENIDATLDRLTIELKEYEKELAVKSLELTTLRKKAAKDIEHYINEELKELNFKDTTFSVSFDDAENGKTNYTVNGVDRIEFLITTNKGETPKPLVKIASGGEISRIMLAFKQIIGDFDRIPTMIFDEIDVGISGITASIVGKKLLDISRRHQIICITHLPQIAAFGDHHYKIDKSAESGATLTSVISLGHNEKVAEIARLLGGINITDTTLKSAEELIRLSRHQEK